MELRNSVMNNKGFLGLIGLLLTVAIISFIAYFMFKQYLGKPTGMDQNTQEMVNQAGIDTASQAGILVSAKSLVNGIEESQRIQSQQLANDLGQ
jgi:multisubunit Na+/H+ antiporter MnhB subunit